MNNIILCGFMGSGKSTVGKALAQRLGMCFFDSDEQIESAEHMKISDIFGAFGERYFRAAEAAVIKRLSSLDGAVIATGGGAVLSSANVAVLRAHGTVIFLSVSPSTVIERLEGDSTRPLLQQSDRKAAIEKMISERLPFYKAAAHFTVDAGGSADDTVQKIISIIAPALDIRAQVL